MSKRFMDRKDFLKRIQAEMPGVRRVYYDGHFTVEVHDAETDMHIECRLVVKRVDREPIRSWRVLQDIKNEIVGADRTAIEVYPPEKDVTDTGNLYHLWVLEEGFQLNLSLVPHRASV